MNLVPRRKRKRSTKLANGLKHVVDQPATLMFFSFYKCPIIAERLLRNPVILYMKVDKSNLVKLNQMLSCRIGRASTDVKRKFDSYLLALRPHPSIV